MANVQWLTHLELKEQTTRTEVLRFLKTRGESEAKTIAEFCGLTTMAVRRHLLKLLADGAIRARTERRPKGRPTTLYSLTDLGDAQFPRDYAGLTSELLGSLEIMDGKSKLNAVFRKRRENLLDRYKHRVQGKDLETRVRETAAILTECGYMAEAARSGSAHFVLTEHNCAIRDVARCYPVACQAELCLIRELTGGDVTRISHMLAGNRVCSYLIEGRKSSRTQRRRGKQKAQGPIP